MLNYQRVCYDLDILHEANVCECAIRKPESESQAFRDFDLLGPPDSYVCLDLRICESQRLHQEKSGLGNGENKILDGQQTNVPQ